MKLLLLIAAIVLFAIAAILAFWSDTTSLRTLIGLSDVGLAVLAAAFLPLEGVVHRT